MLRPRPKVRKLAGKKDTKRLVAALSYHDYVTDSQDRAFDLGAAVRRDAALALASIDDNGDVDAGVALMNSLQDSSAEVRRAAATALGARGEKRAVLPLAEAAVSWDDPRYDSAREAALDALAQLSEPTSAESVVAAALERGDDPERTCEVLARMINGGGTEAAQRATQAAIRGLSDGGPAEHAAEILVWLGPDSVEPLMDVLAQPDSARVEAIGALGSLHDLRSAEALIGLLSDGDASVRKAAAEALGEMSDRKAAQPLFEATNDSDHTVREAARDALQKLGPLAVISEIDSHATPPSVSQPPGQIDRPIPSHRRSSWFRP